MICYQLRCAGDHGFEGWYRDSATFARLQRAGLLSCPDCGTSKVEQAPMAPAIVSSGRARAVAEQAGEQGRELPGGPPDAPDAEPAGASGMGGPGGPVARRQSPAGLPDVVVSAMRQMRRAIEENCENVGERFAEEALRIHKGDAPERGIYGDMTQPQRETLEDEGVEFHTIPWIGKTEN
ncbi:DUF1178 family protein [Acetobacter sp. TBRC 12305]|uniref:DUF1178 family protein n=1 Tax=Acetobacter garciniae TaxID=2817435 RepID=A0A939HL77_9PROT|nr:DUF1178 family protein [Acetobacter garciniae]MBO1324111.1 DUF1178 family protein [Acetobacter garciniae]MBX0343800.1 DUF1178 family protein [Acetobacter garciniae]